MRRIRAEGRSRTDHGPVPADARSVDTDVTGAVGRAIEAVLRERLREAGTVDTVFARDIAERVADFTLSGGKRTRPGFLWWAMRACGGGDDPADTWAALRLGAGLELIQTCALVHDDVMDGSALRRGRPAVHADLAAQFGTGPDPVRGRPFGRSAAVLVGDLSLAWADDIVADTPMAPLPGRRVRSIWRAMRTEMVAGQYLDLHGQATGTRTAAHALRTARLKSALYSVERPLALGAALAGADEPTTRALCSAGRCAGLAFQLRDDLLGVFGDPERTGKPSGDDIREGKPTYLMAMARERADVTGDHRARNAIDAALGDAGLTEEGLERVRDALIATGARAAVEEEIDRLVEDGTRCLAGVAWEPAAGRRLGDLLASVAGASAEPASSPGGAVPGRVREDGDGARPAIGTAAAARGESEHH
ncbi:polyprenyl synthetase family protein [Streptomyces sp. DT24]|uniref:polyprenyl synthetase family protein n=1 Tax=unclassified Streptomyces TaxID=2593676 RepID=UPI003CE8F9EF